MTRYAKRKLKYSLNENFNLLFKKGYLQNEASAREIPTCKQNVGQKEDFMHSNFQMDIYKSIMDWCSVYLTPQGLPANISVNEQPEWFHRAHCWWPFYTHCTSRIRFRSWSFYRYRRRFGDLDQWPCKIFNLYDIFSDLHWNDSKTLICNISSVKKKK
jgi:hypothetical protein